MADNRPIASSTNAIYSTLLLLALLGSWLTLFTIGSQLDKKDQSHVIMKLLTSQEPNILMLGMLSSSMGVWRRRNQNSPETGPQVDYLSAVISGLVSTVAVVVFPHGISSIEVNGAKLFYPDQNTYSVFSLVASFIAFFSGYDKKFFDNWTHWILKKAGLA